MAATWKREAAAIAAKQRRITWRQPSRHEDPAESAREPETVFTSADAILEAIAAEAEETHVQGGRERGSILHKLMEEVLTGETVEDTGSLQVRAAELIAQLGLEDSQDASEGLSSGEMATTVVRTLQLPEIRVLRPRLVPEFRVYAERHRKLRRDTYGRNCRRRCHR